MTNITDAKILIFGYKGSKKNVNMAVMKISYILAPIVREIWLLQL